MMVAYMDFTSSTPLRTERLTEAELRTVQLLHAAFDDVPVYHSVVRDLGFDPLYRMDQEALEVGRRAQDLLGSS